MKCSDCGKEITNWPAWLAGPALKVRCTQCAGAGAVPLNIPMERNAISALVEMRDRWDLAEAA